MKIEPYVCIQGDGKLIMLNGAFTPEELRDILDEAPVMQRCTGVEIDTDELLL